MNAVLSSGTWLGEPVTMDYQGNQGYPVYGQQGAQGYGQAASGQQAQFGQVGGWTWSSFHRLLSRACRSAEAGQTKT